MTLIDILLVVLILSAIALCIYTIVFLYRIFRQVEGVRNDIHELVENTIPVLNNMEEVIGSANRIVSEVEGYWVEIDQSIRSLREKISKFGFWKLLLDAPTQPSRYIKNLRSITKGLAVFWRTYHHS